jgi:flavorubredoxin
VTRQIAPGIHWIYERGPDRSAQFDLGSRDLDWYEDGHEAYIPQCAYLVVGEEETLLFDTLSPASTDHLLDAVESVLGDRGLDHLVVSHPDIPHAGNAAAVLDAFPDADLVAPGYGNDHELYQLGTATRVVEGDTIDLGGRVVEFHEATFLDAPVSVWMTERTSGTLFTVDWMGFPHLDRDALSFVDESEGPFDIEQLVEFHSRVLFWYQYVDVEKVQREIDSVERKFEPEIIAPAHGQVVRTDTESFFELMKRVPEIVDRRGRVGTLG